MGNRVFVGIALLTATSVSVGAETPSIDHQPVGCAVAERFPRMEARFAPTEAVAAAHIVFQPQDTVHWYSVAMKAEGPAFSGVLPRPKKELKAFQYYIEVTDRSLGTSRTANYTTTVVATAAGCQGKIVAGSLGSASVLLQAPEGAAVVPSGFASNGVVVAGRAAAAGTAASGGSAGSGTAVAAAGAAAGGGIGTVAVIGIVAGVGAATAAGVAVAAGSAGNGDDASSEPPPPPPPSPTSYSGPFTGQRTSTVLTGPGPGCYMFTQTLSGTLRITLQPPSGGTVTGTANTTGSMTIVAITGNCVANFVGATDTISWNSTVTGTPGTIVFSDAQTAGGDETISFSGALNGGVISGAVTFARSGDSGFFGVATLPVTLR